MPEVQKSLLEYEEAGLMRSTFIHKYRQFLKQALKNKINTNLHVNMIKRGLHKKTIEEYGIDIDKILDRIGPCPNNHVLDHIMPISIFNLRKDSEVKRAYDSKNLRWADAKENMHKSAKWIDRSGLERFAKRRKIYGNIGTSSDGFPILKCKKCKYVWLYRGKNKIATCVGCNTRVNVKRKTK